ncbi:glycosyltransferase family 9 protein [Catenovulum sp. SM1970]|nr:glycosyltransferase family 9 protein [Marinifaba aquimaris]NTS75720.1 glycosyltransferase family 9 protein [Marinifaba aquimaris]
MASALIPSIKLKYPNAKLAWLVEPVAANLLSENPLLDEVIIWPRAQWQKLWREKRYVEWFKTVRDFIKMLRAHGFDLALDTQGLLKSGIWAFLSGADKKVGLGSKEGTAMLMNQVVERIPDAARISSEYLAMAQSQNFDTECFNMHLPVSEQTSSTVDRLLESKGINQEKGYIVVCPFTTRPQKHWIESYWQEFFKLAQQSQLSLVILGGPGDKPNAERIVKDAKANGIEVTDLCGETKLLEAVNVIDKARLLVGVDTGLTHVGIAQHTPTIAIFGSTRPYTHTTRDNAQVMYTEIECAPCRRRPTCDGDFTCLKKLTAEDVWQQASAYL